MDELVDSGLVEVSIQTINLVETILAHLGCWYLTPTMVRWWWRLQGSPAILRPMLLVVAAFAFGTWLWSLSRLNLMLVLHRDLPSETLAARLSILGAVMLAIWVTVIVRRAVNDRSGK